MVSSFQTPAPFVAPQVPDVVTNALAAATQDPTERPWGSLLELPPRNLAEARAVADQAGRHVAACELLLATPGATHEQRTNALNYLPTYRAVLSRAEVVIGVFTPAEGDAA